MGQTSGTKRSRTGRGGYVHRRKRRAMGTMSRRSRISRSVVSNNVVSIKRQYYMGEFFAPVTAGWSWNAYDFKLSNIPSYVEFTNLFEQYKINAVKLTFVPVGYGGDGINQIYANSTAGAPYFETPRLYTIVDRDGNPQVGTEEYMLQNSKARMIKNPFKVFSVYIAKPCVQQEVGTTLSFAGAAPKSGMWLDCDNTGVLHNGLGIGCQANGSTTASFRWRIVATYYMQFKIAK